MKEKLKKFIKDNNLTFKEGTRNHDSTILSGYALHLGTQSMTDVMQCIEEVCPDSVNYREEFIPVFTFAKQKGYGSWWAHEDNRKAYKL